MASAASYPSRAPNNWLDDASTFARSHAQTEVCPRQRGSGSGRRSGLAVDGTIFEPNDPQLVQIEIPLSRLPEAWDGITIAQLSNFHYDDRCSVVPLGKAIHVVNHFGSTLTGDFVQFLSSRERGNLVCPQSPVAASDRNIPSMDSWWRRFDRKAIANSVPTFVVLLRQRRRVVEPCAEVLAH